MNAFPSPTSKQEVATQSAPVTLQQVAGLANCSVASASKALLGRSDISSDLRERVEEAAAELGYRRKPRKGTSPGQRQSITLAFDSFGSLYSAELLSGMVAAGKSLAYETNVAELPSATREAAIFRNWVERQLDSGHRGAVLITSDSPVDAAEISKANSFPLVTIDPRRPLQDHVISVGATNWAGGVEATEHLLSLGHRRIAYAGYYPQASFAWERFNGYQSALEAAGITPDRRLAFAGKTDYGDGFSIGEKIARMHPERRPTAVVCLCDAVAFGIIESTRQQGLVVPDELSVVGFDDILPARWASPPLTTIRQPIHRMGALSVRTLVRLLNGEEPDSHHVQLATSLKVRKSAIPYQGSS